MTGGPPLPFRCEMRIYWEDTDAAGIVFYANYLKFFERARTEWLRSLGFGQEALRQEAGLAFVVSATEVRYRRPARLDDIVSVSVDVLHLGQASLEIAQEARRADELLAEGTIRIGCVELGTFRPCRIPNDIRLALHR
jgi:acyl-CoA thioester hydrolase